LLFGNDCAALFSLLSLSFSLQGTPTLFLRSFIVRFIRLTFLLVFSSLFLLVGLLLGPMLCLLSRLDLILDLNKNK
jgi:hypothetical protein